MASCPAVARIRQGASCSLYLIQHSGQRICMPELRQTSPAGATDPSCTGLTATHSCAYQASASRLSCCAHLAPLLVLLQVSPEELQTLEGSHSRPRADVHVPPRTCLMCSEMLTDLVLLGRSALRSCRAWKGASEGSTSWLASRRQSRQRCPWTLCWASAGMTWTAWGRI